MSNIIKELDFFSEEHQARIMDRIYERRLIKLGREFSRHITMGQFHRTQPPENGRYVWEGKHLFFWHPDEIEIIEEVRNESRNCNK